MKTMIRTMLALLLMPSAMMAQKYLGGDISLLPSYEANGSKYFDHEGNAIASPLTFFAQQGMNAMRVRLFVNPDNASEQEKGEGVCQNLNYVIALGKRVKDEGMKLMLDIHYSDSWADPQKQRTPKEWLQLGESALADRVYTYTRDVLMAMVEAGATPDFIQTGNEISYGMMWGPEGTQTYKCVMGRKDNWQRFITLLKRGGEACREVCPDAKIVIHTERAETPEVMMDFYERMRKAQLDYDIIGLSYYPYFHNDMPTLDNAIALLEKTYPQREIMIVEAGYPLKWGIGGSTFDYTSVYPYTDEGQRRFTADLVGMLNAHANVTGLFWWWQEANEYGHSGGQQVTKAWYNASLFDNETGRATSAMSELRRFLQPTSIAPVAAEMARGGMRSTLAGIVTDDVAKKGIYIEEGKKMIVR